MAWETRHSSTGQDSNSRLARTKSEKQQNRRNGCDRIARSKNWWERLDLHMLHNYIRRNTTHRNQRKRPKMHESRRSNVNNINIIIHKNDIKRKLFLNWVVCCQKSILKEQKGQRSKTSKVDRVRRNAKHWISSVAREVEMSTKPRPCQRIADSGTPRMAARQSRSRRTCAN